MSICCISVLTELLIELLFVLYIHLFFQSSNNLY